MKCPKCGFENKPGAELCAGCKAVRFTSVLRPTAAGAKPTASWGAGARPNEAPALTPVPQAAPKPKTVKHTGQTTKTGKTTKVKMAKLPLPATPARRSTTGHFLMRAGAPPLELKPGESFTIGRQASCSLSIPSKRISRVHAEIRWEDGRPVISDKGSANGVFVGGARVTDHKLAPGDELEIGPFLCVYQYVDPAKPAPVHEAEAPADQSAKTVAVQADALSGQIDANGVAEVLQSLELGKKSGTLKVFSRRFTGWLTVHEGVPIAAEAGDSKGFDAALEILDQTAGRFTFGPVFKADEKTMKTTITGLLLEWGRRKDERFRFD
ncbi:FHA domain-containing protein [bacterium]|nr:FHA domain-containing protein [bacterium]